MGKAFEELTTDEVLEHYGYKPENIRWKGVGYGIWEREEAFKRLGEIRSFMDYVDEKEKAKVEFNYDPDYPAALLITYVVLKVKEKGMKRAYQQRLH